MQIKCCFFKYTECINRSLPLYDRHGKDLLPESPEKKKTDFI